MKKNDLELQVVAQDNVSEPLQNGLHTPTATLDSRSLVGVAELRSNPSQTEPWTPPISPNVPTTLVVQGEQAPSTESAELIRSPRPLATANVELPLTAYGVHVTEFRMAETNGSFYLKVRQYTPPAALLLSVTTLGMLLGGAVAGPSTEIGKGLLGGSAGSFVLSAVTAGLSIFNPCRKRSARPVAQAQQQVSEDAPETAAFSM